MNERSRTINSFNLSESRGTNVEDTVMVLEQQPQVILVVIQQLQSFMDSCKKKRS